MTVVKSKKKSKEESTHYLPKNVTAYSTVLSDPVFKELDQLFVNYGHCRSMFINDLSGINNLEIVNDYRSLRKQIIKKHFNKILMKRYHFLSRFWVHALQDACANVQAMWGCTRNRMTKAIYDNFNMADDEKYFLNFILCYSHLWLGVLQHNDDAYLDLSKKDQDVYLGLVQKLSANQLQHAKSYLRRITRRYKLYPRRISRNNRSMNYDQSMYLFYGDKHVHLMATKPKKRLRITLTSHWHYSKTSSIRVILNRDKRCLELHRMIKSHIAPLQSSKSDNVVGIDKGLYSLISCSSGREYGLNYTNFSQAEVDRLYQKNKGRFKNIINDQFPSDKQYRKQHASKKAYLLSLINRAVKQMLLTERPSLIVKEDLSFAERKMGKAHSFTEVKRRRYLTFWYSGELNRRIEYYCKKFGIPFVNVNPAYTSQYCPFCGHKFIDRIGSHKEFALCVNCGPMNANVAAAINVKHRKDDPDITLLTPYKKVKEILDSRI